MTEIIFVLQLAAQVLDEFDDEEIGVGLIDAKHDKAIAKKLGECTLKTWLNMLNISYQHQNKKIFKTVINKQKKTVMKCF